MSLEVALLGPPEFRLLGQPLAFRTRKVLALAAYLAAEGTPQPRERLLGLLWPDSEPEAARNSLRNTLSALREAFAGLPANPVQADRLEVRLEAVAVQASDLRELERAAGSDDPALLERAARLYRGEFMDGFALADAEAFEEWLELRRAEVRRRFGAVLERLSALREGQGDLRGALEAAERWQAVDRFGEEALRRRMHLHLALGERAAGLEAYARFARLLQGELGVEPGAQTRALAARLESEAPAARVAEARSRVPALPTLLLEGRMVGRASEYVRLVEAYHAACCGLPQAVVLEGEPGIGKTRLAQEFVGWAAAQGAEVLRGRAYETGGSLAYQPIADALRRRLRSAGDVRSWLEPAWLAELMRLLPELQLGHPDLSPPAVDEALARTRLFESVVAFGRALAARAGGGLVFFLDDLQWADDASRELLAYAAQRWADEETPVLLLFTVRSEALAGAGATAAWLAALGRGLPSVRLSLPSLSREETGRLLELLFGEEEREGLEPFARWLYAQTGGQPLYIHETLKALSERGLLAAGPAGGWRVRLEGLPEAGSVAPGVRAVIEARLAGLSPEARGLLEAAAVLGQDFGFEPLRAVADLPEAVALPALDELLRGRLLLESGRAYAFSHDRVREVAYALAGEARRRAYHRRALDALEARRAPAPVLALHALAAEEWPRAYDHLLEAGAQAMQVYAWRSAAEFYEQALELVRRPPPGLEPVERLRRRHNPVARLASLYSTLNEWGRQHKLALEAVELARSLGDPLLQARALSLLAGKYEIATPEQALELYREAYALAERSGDAETLLSVKISLAGVAEGQGADDWEEYRRLEELLPAARALGPSHESWCLGRMAMIQQTLGDWAGAVENWRRSFAVETQPDLEIQTHYGHLRSGLAYIQENLGICALNQGDLALALEALEKAYRIKQEVDDNPTYVAVAGSFLSFALLEAGRLEEALELAGHSHALGWERTGHPQFRVFYALALGMARQALGELEGARAAFGAALGAVGTMPAALWGWWGRLYLDFLHSHLCANAALAGDWERALGHALEALEFRAARSYERGAHTPRLPLWLETEALLRGGEAERARQALGRLGAAVQPGERLEITWSRARAALLGWEGRRAEALELLEQAQRQARSLGLRGECWSLEVQKARVERRKTLEPNWFALEGLDLSQGREKALREQIESFLMTD